MTITSAPVSIRCGGAPSSKSMKVQVVEVSLLDTPPKSVPEGSFRAV